jgi:thiosulfate/3-mercaptopyruvate sulfurtransferase
MSFTKIISRISIGLALMFGLVAGAQAQSNSLVTADWLEKNLTNPKVRIIEVSVDAGTYERGHIPGAVNFRWHTDLVDTVKRDVVSRENFARLVSDAGIDKDTVVVIYGDHNNWFAAWGAWVFEMNGLGAQTKLLDGGLKLWEAKGLPMETKTPTYQATNFKLPPQNKAVRAHLTDVIVALENKGDVKLVDIRSPAEFEGKVIAPEGIKELSVRAGHIPGAVNFPWGKAVNADGTFKSAADLKKEFDGLGIDGSKQVIVYCRIGERSSHTWFLLSKILGYSVKNYDGSWTEYGNSVGVPIVNIAGTVWQGK